MINLSHVSKQYGAEHILRDVSLRIGDGERLAVVGPNGAGKSTLMKIILGVVDPDSGEIQSSRSHTAGYLPQDGVVHTGRTLAEEAATAFDDLLELHARAEGIHGEIDLLAAGGKGESLQVGELVEELGKIQHHLEHREGWSIEGKVREILFGLGFKANDLDRATSEFSGGWQMRLALAKLLLREPTVLMLDEPTNHLDMESLQWVEEYLGGYEGSVVLISHDRRFLDTVAKRTVELVRGRLIEYRGSYSYYLKEKRVRSDLLRAQYENQQEKIRETMRFVERFRAKNTKASQVQSRLRMLEKMDLVEIEEEEEGGIAFRFPPAPSPGKVVMQLEGLRKEYGSRKIFSGLDLTLVRGDRLALLGPNGTGKSTMARILAGLEPFQGGSRKSGHNVTVSYYAQHQAEELDPEKTVLQTLEDEVRAGRQQSLRSLLGCFLFKGDDVEKKVEVLSGGEKSRLALAKMLLTPANFLVLDEPTNHLDRRSKGVVQEALRNFDGTCVLISHDRDFLEPLITKVAEFRNGKAWVFQGSVSEYLDRLRQERNEAAEKASEAGGGGVAPAAMTPARLQRERKRLAAVRRQERSRRLKPLTEALAKNEKKIAELEGRKKEVERELALDATCRNSERARSLAYEYEECTAALSGHYEEWTALQEKKEAVDRDFPEGG
jgi:ATP-binding cassette subfamily F protein 3